MPTKLIRMTHKMAIQLHLVAESCTIYAVVATGGQSGNLWIYPRMSLRGKMSLASPNVCARACVGKTWRGDSVWRATCNKCNFPPHGLSNVEFFYDEQISASHSVSLCRGMLRSASAVQMNYQRDARLDVSTAMNIHLRSFRLWRH
jgi:hypothetical protein